MSFNANNPPTSSLLVSGDMRANFLATQRSLFDANLVGDPLFECWPETDSIKPAYYTFAGGTIVRDTTGSRLGVGKMGARITGVGSAATLDQRILRTVDYDSYFDNRVVTAGVFAHSAAVGAFVQVFDGVNLISSAGHTGGGAVEFLNLEQTIDPGATELRIRCATNDGVTATFSGLVYMVSDIKPDRFVMGPMARGTILHTRGGEAFTGQVAEFEPQRPFIVEHVQLRAGVSPTGSDLIVDVNSAGGGGGQNSMFTVGGRPRIVAGVNDGGSAPDGSYNKKCFTGTFGSPGIGGLLISEIDQVGLTTPGENLAIHTRFKTWLRPQEIFAQFDSQGQG